MSITLATLPPELYSSILAFVPAEELQQTTHALICALPSRPVPRHHLFTYIRLTWPGQAVKLYLHLRGELSAQRNGVFQVRELSLESWNVDADVFINVVRLLPNLNSLSLRVGPSNFTPEHLEELFGQALYSRKLKYLSLRFRPYVQKATYFQFLKGAYFDSTLAALSKWPQTSPLPVLSIVQDPLDAALATAHPRQSFAQPIVFFRLDVYLSVLLHSRTMARSLNAFRLRIPTRPVARPLCTTPPPVRPNEDRINLQQYFQNLNLGEWRSGDMSRTPPMLKYLDLSTCGVLEGEVDMILMRYHTLEHLVLDGCSVLRGEFREGEWAAMGKRCALIGVRRAKEREKKVKAWLETQIRSENTVAEDEDAAGGPAAAVEARLPRRGRRGLASATISLREREPRRYGPSALAPTSGGTPRIRILPPLPTLRSLSTTLSPPVRAEKHAAIESEFEAGWIEGVAQLGVARARVWTSVGSGVRVVQFSRGSAGEEEGLEGLEEVEGMEMEARERLGAPVLCLVGAGADGHADKCGHEMGKQIWKEWDGVM
ncbi:hypothetical protein AX15_004032 [Amanita polypyramis BW_CC]|nr:hypothetical protein AX15_004032 [Amanita polypyramis BW_CC]